MKRITISWTPPIDAIPIKFTLCQCVKCAGYGMYDMLDNKVNCPYCGEPAVTPYDASDEDKHRFTGSGWEVRP